MADEKGPGQGRGAFTRAGVQRAQADAIAALEGSDAATAEILSALDARLTAVEDFLETAQPTA